MFYFPAKFQNICAATSPNNMNFTLVTEKPREPISFEPIKNYSSTKEVYIND